MTEQAKGLLLTTLGVLLIVPDSLFVRMIDGAPMVTAFWRGMTSGVFVLLVVLALQGLQGFRALLGTGWAGVIYTFLIATSTPAFVLAVANTSVANVVFIFASMPVFAAIFSRIFLGETVSRRMVLTMIPVIFGLGVIAYGSGSSQVASWKGDLWALYVSASYAAALTAVRTVKAVSMVPTIPIAYIGAALLIWLVETPLPAFDAQWHLFIGHGVFVGAASCLLALGPRYIGSAEAALLLLLESVLAPLLVWAVVGEDPGPWALIGGAIVIGALVVSNLVVLLRSRQ